MSFANTVKKINSKFDILTDKSKLAGWIDLCITKYAKGFGAEDYFSFEFWKKSGIYRKQYMSDRTRKAFEKKCNASKDVLIIGDKYKFNEFFREYVNRDYMCLDKITFEDFAVFCKKQRHFVL